MTQQTDFQETQRCRRFFITSLARHFQQNNQKLAQSHVMHLAYLAQELYDIPLDYYFYMYVYGPQAPYIPEDVRTAKSKGIINVNYGQDTDEDIVPVHTGEEGTAELPQILEWTKSLKALLANFGHHDPKQLSLRTTLAWLVKKDNIALQDEQTYRVIHNIKPHLNREEVAKAIEDITKLVDRNPRDQQGSQEGNEDTEPVPEASGQPAESQSWRTWEIDQCSAWLKAETEEAMERYRNGRTEYGPTFVGDLLQHLKEEVLDVLFYRWSAERERAFLLAQLKEARQKIIRLEGELKAREKQNP